jgi:NAD(P)-dependent dehydrogenase (short-subunit alcohol dehydrogenase family)
MASVKGSIIITGSNGGLGSAIVDQILHQPEIAKNHRGIYTVRNLDNATSINRVLEKANSVGHLHELVTLDLASLASVRKTAEGINKRVADGSLPPIRALILNAAWQEHTTHSFTEDAFDMTFQANYLSHFLLTLLLLQSMDKEHGRIVVLSSWTHEYAIFFSHFVITELES